MKLNKKLVAEKAASITTHTVKEFMDKGADTTTIVMIMLIDKRNFIRFREELFPEGTDEVDVDEKAISDASNVVVKTVIDDSKDKGSSPAELVDALQTLSFMGDLVASILEKEGETNA